MRNKNNTISIWNTLKIATNKQRHPLGHVRSWKVVKSYIKSIWFSSKFNACISVIFLSFACFFLFFLFDFKHLVLWINLWFCFAFIRTSHYSSNKKHFELLFSSLCFAFGWSDGGFVVITFTLRFDIRCLLYTSFVRTIVRWCRNALAISICNT